MKSENFVEVLAPLLSLCLTDEENKKIRTFLNKPYDSFECQVPECGGLHRNSCIVNCTRGFLRSFVVGFGVKYTANTIPLLIKKFRFFSFKKHLSKDSLGFALFLSVFLSSYRGLYCILRRKNLTWPVSSFFAGSIASLALLIDKNKSRRTLLSLYVLTRALEYLCKYIFRNFKSKWTKIAAPTLMMLSSSQILFSFIVYPNTLAKSYYKFILGQSNVRKRLNPTEIVAYVDFLQNSVKTSSEILCDSMHPNISCKNHFVTSFETSMRQSFLMYAPLHLIMMLISKRFNVKSWLMQTARSCVFLSGYISTAWGALCVLRMIFKKEHLWFYMVNGLCSGAWSLLEPPYRRLELAMYCLPRALEAFWKCLILMQILPKKSILTSKKYGEPLYFALSTGILMCIYETHPEVMSKTYVNFMERFFGIN